MGQRGIKIGSEWVGHGGRWRVVEDDDGGLVLCERLIGRSGQPLKKPTRSFLRRNLFDDGRLKRV